MVKPTDDEVEQINKEYESKHGERIRKRRIIPPMQDGCGRIIRFDI